MLSPKVASDIERWLKTSEGNSFAQSVTLKLESLDHPETLVKIGVWPEVQPFKNFLQQSYGRPQKPGELKGCLDRIVGVRISGPVGQEVAGLASKNYWQPYSGGGNGADAPLKPIRSWEDYFQANDINCFFGVISIKPSAEHPGNTWVELKECYDASGSISEYSFSCKDEKVAGVVEGGLVLGRRNQRLLDRPFFFAGDRVPVEIVDWKELKIAGSAREFLAKKNQGSVHVDCKCYFKDLLVVDNDLIYSGIQYSRENGEIFVGEEWREGDVKKFLAESKQTCWMYLLDWGADKGLFRLLAPKEDAGLTTSMLIARVGSQPMLPPIVESCSWMKRNENEEAFLRRFSKYREESHFVYTERDVIRFHTGVKLGLVSLLTGDPGCGKSSLARLYANALAGRAQKSGKDSLFIRTFVNRTWISPYDMLGYPKRDGAEVQESDNGLLHFLRMAARDSEKSVIRCVCFEEMNLAQVEHYFSDFMQILSGDDAKNRDSLPGFACGGNPLPIGDNLVFIGTCNNDSTVRQFSGRFLDRCNLVNLSSRTDEGGFDSVFADAAFDAALGGVRIDADELNAWSVVESEQLRALLKSELNEFIAKLKPLFREAGVPVDHRALKKISKYMCCRPRGTEESDFTASWFALDEALVQMVVPKISPTRRAMNAIKEIAAAMKLKFISLGFPLNSSLTADALEKLIGSFRDSLGFVG